MNSTPKVTIITPTYNKAHLLKKTIGRVLAQDFKDFEYLIIDDCSTDNTKKMVSEIKDPRLKYLSTSSNSSGPALPMTIGVQNSLADYIAIIDHDDLPRKNWISDLYGAINKSKNLGLAWGQHAVRDENESLISVAFRNPFVNSLPKKIPFLLSWTPGTSGLMVKKNVFNDIGFFDQKAGIIADLDFTYRFANTKEYEVAYVPTIVIDYISHKSNLSLSSHLSLAKSMEYFTQKNQSTLSEFPKIYAGYLYKTAWFYNEAGEKSKTFLFIHRAISNDPKNLKYKVFLILNRLGIFQIVKPFSYVRAWCSGKIRLLKSVSGRK